MSTKNTNSNIPNDNGKGNRFTTEQKKVHETLKLMPMTMKEVFIETGIMRENICRYIDVLLENGKIAITRKRKCKVTGHTGVTEYTANKELFPKDNQLDLFNDRL